ncbi:MAG: chromate transporter [Oscillospiraceae bacterium]|nr:chromate transporter [Oscillospiraceae bacterium]
MIFLELFFSFLMIGFTSFGGLSMIPLISDQMLSHGWMTASEVADIVAIAEMTPGPLGLNCATFAGARTAGLAGAIAASVGVLFPTLTLTVLAAMFLEKFKQNRLLDEALFGIRPVCIGMISAVIVQQSIGNYAGTLFGFVSWPAVVIGLVSLLTLIRLKWSVARTIVLAAVLGIVLCGVEAGLPVG